MPRGGKRPGAGRKTGAITQKISEHAQQLALAGQTPLDLLLGVMRDPNNPLAMRMDAATRAAPYVHPRLNAVEHSGSVHVPHEAALDQLDDDDRDGVPLQ
jgi:hypothetical protein